MQYGQAPSISGSVMTLPGYDVAFDTAHCAVQVPPLQQF